MLISQIRIDATQIRESMSTETVDAYAELMKEGVSFPPIIVFEDDTGRYWLADGFHRLEARKKTVPGLIHIDVDLRKGSKLEAILYSRRINGAHGLPLTRAAKKHAIVMVLKECPDADQKWIAEKAGCTQGYVSQIARELRGEAPYKSKIGSTNISSNTGTTNSVPAKVSDAQELPPVPLVQITPVHAFDSPPAPGAVATVVEVPLAAPETPAPIQAVDTSSPSETETDESVDMDEIKLYLRAKYKKCSETQKDEFLQMMISIVDSLKNRETALRMARLQAAEGEAKEASSDEAVAAGIEYQRMMAGMHAKEERRRKDDDQVMAVELQRQATKATAHDRMLADLGEVS